MKLTKFEHSCMVLEKNGRVIVIDPGGFSESFRPVPNTDALIIAHEHGDHYDPDKIAAIRELNPDVKIFTTASVAKEVDGATEIHTGDKVTIGGFDIEFFGHDHAPILDNVVPCDNFGVVVDGVFSYAGDSFAIPPVHPTVIALPASAPWLKVDESVKYMTAVKPARAFPTHNALLSKSGESVVYNWLNRCAAECGTEFIDLQPGQSIEI